MKWHKWLLLVPLFIAGPVVWYGVPAGLAAAKALDHPAWNNVSIDAPPRGYLGLTIDEPSLWPPGRRYEWRGADTGESYTAIDPWAHPAIGHTWTAVVAAAAAGATFRLTRRHAG